MKYIKLFESISKYNIETKLKRYGIENYTINDDGTVDVDGDVQLYSKNLIRMPIKFGKVTGNFLCFDSRLESLDGSPYYVGGNFNCSNNFLINLNGSPVEIVGNFDCCSNRLESLEGMSLEIGENFYCLDNQILKELYSISNIEGYIYCDRRLDISKFDGYCKKIIQK